MLLKCSSKNCRKSRAPKRRICWSCIELKKKLKDPIKYSYGTFRRNARRRGILFTISLEYFRKFAYEVDLTQKRGRVATAYHIDRKIDELGYVEGNLQLLTCHDNVMKEHERRRVSKQIWYDWQTKQGGIIDYRYFIDQDNEPCPF